MSCYADARIGALWRKEVKKKILIKLIFFLCLITCLLSCKSRKSNTEERNIDKENISEEIKFPFVTKQCVDNEIISTYLKGKLLTKYDELPSQFNDPLVFECESNYYYNNEKRTSTYQLIYVGTKILENPNPNFDTNIEFAQATTNELKLICRSKELDKYLISCSTALPQEYNGYFYFLPGMLLNTTMKYLHFVDIHEYDYKWLYHHTVDEDQNDPDWAPGFSKVFWDIYINTELTSYPEILDTPIIHNGIQHERRTEIIYDGIKFELFFQPNFKKYLEEECKIGDKIYYYLNVEGCNFFTKSYSAYVRDFSIKSPEEIIDERINLIKEQLNIK